MGGESDTTLSPPAPPDSLHCAVCVQDLCFTVVIGTCLLEQGARRSTNDMIDNDLTISPDTNAGDALFQKLFRKHSSIMLLIDPANGVVIDANGAACRFYGYAEDAFRGMNISQINTQPEEEIRREMQNALQEQRNYFIFQHRLANGELRLVEIHSSAIDYSNRQLLFSIAFDITKRKQAEDSLRLASLVYQNSSEAMAVVDTASRIIAINPAFTEITGYTAEEAIEGDRSLLQSHVEDPDAYCDMRKQVRATGRWQGELWSRRKNGERFLRWLSMSTIYGDDGRVQCRVGLFSDVTKKRETDELIWRQANFDALTALPNRAMFHDRLEQAIKKAARHSEQVALLFIDIDYFKEVNDTLGHPMGDTLLQIAARRLNHCVRDTDTVARLGGDEFTVILGELDEAHNIERVVQNILRAMAEPFVLGTERVHVSGSIGITMYPQDGTDTELLLKHADQALYAAKANGRNRCSYFTPSLQEAAQNRKRLVNDLRIAIQEQQFEVYYQPIVDLATGQIRKAEALVRWHHPERGIVSPAEFIPIAEETGMVMNLGDWVFRQAAHQIAAWRERHHPAFQISVNVSPVQLQDDGINHDAWLYYLERLNLSGSAVVVEITENLLMDASTSVTDQLLKFRDSGVQVALDDFGTGYSSLAYLKKFDIDYLKIDRAFVQNLEPGSDDMALCEAIIVMAHKLGIKVIAEGVETAVQRDLLAACGCDFAQGFFFSRPVPSEEFEKLFQQPVPVSGPFGA
jgi:diguanylate cyclase (GGDEF)-like protein/PAS domain S-box-containing protein